MRITVLTSLLTLTLLSAITLTQPTELSNAGAQPTTSHGMALANHETQSLSKREFLSLGLALGAIIVVGIGAALGLNYGIVERSNERDGMGGGADVDMVQRKMVHRMMVMSGKGDATEEKRRVAEEAVNGILTRMRPEIEKMVEVLRAV